MGLSIAIVGATGNVGTEMLTILSESDLEVADVYAVASRRSIGREVSYGDKTLKCHDLEQFDFSKVDIALIGCPSGCPGSKRGCCRGVRQEGHYRESQLLDHSNGRGAKTAP